MTKKEIVFKYVEAELSDVNAPGSIDSALEYARGLIEEGRVEGPEQSVARYVREAIQDLAEDPGEEAGKGRFGRVASLVVYVESEDVYRCYKPGAPFEVSGEDYREMRRDYVNPPAGNGMTVNGVCKKWGIARPDFEFLKTEAGWTHDTDEFTTQEHATKTVREMMNDREMRSRRRLEVEWMREQQKRDAADADRWRAFSRSTLEELKAAVAEPVPYNPSGDVRSGEELFVFSPSDLHLGKLGVDGYNLEVAYARVWECADYFFTEARERGINDALIVLGNDWGHIDNPHSQTTRGTPQDSAPYREVVRWSAQVARGLVEYFAKEFDRTKVVVVPSNHSKAGDFWLEELLSACFPGRVLEAGERTYFTWGQNLVGLEHGDGAKDADLPMIMAKEKPQQWASTKYRYWLTGHLHHLREIDRGVIICQAPSLSGADRWHDKNGYVLADKLGVAYIFDKQLGQTQRWLCPASI